MVKQTKYIVVTGGVLSGLGKGIAAAAIGNLLSSKLKVIPIKCDGYLNTDPGTMNPTEHGEVFVLDDGGEVDMDFGHYERFLGITCKFEWNLTMGKVFQMVNKKERDGEFLGRTVQYIPHVTDTIKQHFHTIAKKEDADIVIIEIGGTVGDMENELYLESVRQLAQDIGKENVVFVHLTYVPKPDNVGELKTKPTQNSVKDLHERGIWPDVLIARCTEYLTENAKQKISRFCNIPKEAIITGIDVDSVYKMPVIFDRQGLTALLHQRLGIYSPPDLYEWRRLVDAQEKQDAPLTIHLGIAGKYTGLHDSYASIIEAVKHAAAHVEAAVVIDWFDTEEMEQKKLAPADVLKGVDAVIVPGGFGTRGIEGKISVVRHCREHKVPFLGICYGMQLAVIEYARTVCGMAEANTVEVEKDTGVAVGTPIICYLPEQIKITRMGATMRRGGYDVHLDEGSLAARCYGSTVIRERFRHRYEVNPEFVERLTRAGVHFSGYTPDKSIMQVMELQGHPYFIGTQFHPELTSRLEAPGPLFLNLIRTAIAQKRTVQLRAVDRGPEVKEQA